MNVDVALVCAIAPSKISMAASNINNVYKEARKRKQAKYRPLTPPGATLTVFGMSLSGGWSEDAAGLLSLLATKAKAKKLDPQWFRNNYYWSTTISIALQRAIGTRLPRQLALFRAGHWSPWDNDAPFEVAVRDPHQLDFASGC